MNRLLLVTRQTIPYVKELRPYAGSVTACILWQQLEILFHANPDTLEHGLDKFLEPCSHKDYCAGESWTEELGFSCDEFRTAFDKIGVRHASKTSFKNAGNPFGDRYYCSYHDKISGKTHYLRNHAAVEQVLDQFSSTRLPQSGG